MNRTTIELVNGKFEVTIVGDGRVTVFSKPTMQEALLALLELEPKEGEN